MHAILPVIDLKGRHVVRGIAGQREKYQPIVSCLADDSTPANIASGLVRAFGFTSVYVADLDAIAGESPDWSAYSAIDTAGMQMWIDGGLARVSQVTALNSFAVALQCSVRYVIGLESVTSLDSLRAILDVVPSHQLVFSLDLKNGRPITAIPAWASSSAEDIADEVHSSGIKQFIVLDLASVGTGSGPTTLSLCVQLRSRYPDAVIVSGGGVRHVNDVQSFLDHGCDSVLVASALHDGRITSDDVVRLNVANRQ